MSKYIRPDVKALLKKGKQVMIETGASSLGASSSKASSSGASSSGASSSKVVNIEPDFSTIKFGEFDSVAKRIQEKVVKDKLTTPPNIAPKDAVSAKEMKMFLSHIDDIKYKKMMNNLMIDPNALSNEYFEKRAEKIKARRLEEEWNDPKTKQKVGYKVASSEPFRMGKNLAYIITYLHESKYLKKIYETDNFIRDYFGIEDIYDESDVFNTFDVKQFIAELDNNYDDYVDLIMTLEQGEADEDNRRDVAKLFLRKMDLKNINVNADGEMLYTRYADGSIPTKEEFSKMKRFYNLVDENELIDDAISDLVDDTVKYMTPPPKAKYDDSAVLFPSMFYRDAFRKDIADNISKKYMFSQKGTTKTPNREEEEELM